MSFDSERLLQFFGAYFHQDWAHDAPDYSGIVDRYIADFPDRTGLLALANDLDALGTAYANDSALEAVLLGDFLCNFAPSGTGLSARAWVRELAAQIRSHSAS